MNIVSMPEQTWAFLEGRGAMTPQSIGAALASAFDDVNRRITDGDIRTVGAPRAHYRACGGAELGFEIGVPINPDDTEAARKTGLSIGETFKGEALLHIHRGSDALLGDAYREKQKAFQAKGLKGRSVGGLSQRPGRLPLRRLAHPDSLAGRVFLGLSTRWVIVEDTTQRSREPDQGNGL